MATTSTTSKKLNFFYSEHWRGYQSKLFLISQRVSVVTVYVRFAEMTGDRHYNERAHSPCKAPATRSNNAI